MIYRYGLKTLTISIKTGNHIIPTNDTYQLFCGFSGIRENECVETREITSTLNINGVLFTIIVQTNMPQYRINTDFVSKLLISHVQNLPKIMDKENFFTTVGNIIELVMNDDMSYSFQAIPDLIGCMQYYAIKNKMLLIDVLQMNLHFFASDMYNQRFGSISTNRLKVLFSSLLQYLMNEMPNLFIKFQKIFLEHIFELMPGSSQKIVDELNKWKIYSFETNKLNLAIFHITDEIMLK